MKYVLILGGLLAAAAVATYLRYESLHPCDWLVRDAARHSGLPLLAEEARWRADFLARGVAKPGADDCLGAWWRLRADGAAPAS